MSETVVIDRRFCGPPDSANGGYACGLLAARVGNPAEVTLRQPPPLDRPLTVEVSDDGARLLDGETLVAEARAVPTLELDVPDGVPFPVAETAGAGSWINSTPHDHPFPTCFVCGPDREPGDGMRVFVGPVAGRAGLYAAPWVPDRSLAPPDAGGVVSPEYVWAALDCSGGIGGLYDIDAEHGPYVLGRLTAEIVAPVAAGERCVALGWQIGASGRKLETGSAVYAADGTLAGRARATWIAIGGG
ncbi:MAG TPA: hypothetical protein VF152_12005 [Acidimicrobiia bacterium]